MTKLVAIVSALATLASAAAAQGTSIPEPKTEAGVLAADDDWLAAERRGDVTALDARLAPAYRDIEANGHAYVKADLLRSTANRKEKATEPPAKVAADYRLKNPIGMKVVIVGDTAILSFHPLEPDQAARVISVDVFAYVEGTWRGILSDHGATPPVKPAG